jgi:hypothetical protein
MSDNEQKSPPRAAKEEAKPVATKKKVNHEESFAKVFIVYLVPTDDL